MNHITNLFFLLTENNFKRAYNAGFDLTNFARIPEDAGWSSTRGIHAHAIMKFIFFFYR